MDNLSEKAASVVIKYTDLDNNLAELSNSGSLTGNIGEVINYSTADEIKNQQNKDMYQLIILLIIKGKRQYLVETKTVTWLLLSMVENASLLII